MKDAHGVPFRSPVISPEQQVNPHWKRNVGIVCIALFFSNAGLTMIVPFIALYLSSALGVTNPDHIAIWAGAIVAANFVTSFFLQPFWGKMADRYGRKLILLRSGVGTALVIACMGLATQAWHLLLLRMIGGLVSGFNPSANALISSQSPPDKIGTVMGVMQSVMMSGMVFGPLIGGWMTTLLSYQDIFYWTGGMLLASNVLLWLTVHERFQKPVRPHASSTKKASPRLKQIPHLQVVFYSTLLVQFAIVGMTPLIPIYIGELHVPSEQVAFWTGMVSAAAGVSNMVLAPVTGKLCDRYGAKSILFISLLISIVAIFPQAIVTSVEQLAWARLIMGIGIGGLIPCLNTLIRQLTPTEMISSAYGVNGSYSSLGCVLGSVVSGMLVGWIGMSGVLIVTGLLLSMNAYGIYKYFIKGI